MDSRIMEATFAKYKAKSTLRGIAGIALSWLVIAVAICLVERVHIWFYPIAILILANRFLALSLYAHEAVHGNLCESPKLNDFLGRYLCAYPTLTSFSRYKAKHLLHHRLLGSVGDPDLGLYKDYPLSRSAFFSRIVKGTLSGRLVFEFFDYYSDIPDFFRGRSALVQRQAFPHGDLGRFILFHAALLGLLLWLNVLPAYFWYWLVPLLVCVPYFHFIGGLQHAPHQAALGNRFGSRTVTGAKWKMAVLLPVNINYHATHHLNPSIPQYRLRQLSADLNGQKVEQWSQTYSDAVRLMFLR